MDFRNHKITHVRDTSIVRDLKKENHISYLIEKLDLKVDRNIYTEIKKTVARVGKSSYIVFDLLGESWWCKEEEFNTIKFAIENTTQAITIFYVIGSVSPYPVNQLGNSGIDGYELHVLFN